MQIENEVHGVIATSESLSRAFGFTVEEISEMIKVFAKAAEVIVEKISNIDFEAIQEIIKKVEDYYEYEEVKAIERKGWRLAIGFKPKQFNIIRKPFIRARTTL